MYKWNSRSRTNFNIPRAMIRNILQLLREFDYMIGNETIDIAKGKYEMTTKFSELYKQKKRELISKKKNNGRN